MGNLLQSILKFIRNLLGGSDLQVYDDIPSGLEECVVFDNEIPASQDLADLPFYPASETSDVVEVSAQGINISCQIQVRPSLGRVNVRVGPRLTFPVIAQTEGGTFFDLQGASEADPDGFRWFTIKTPDGTGWVRGDTVIIGEDCLAFTFIDESDLTPPEPTIPPPTTRFPLPAVADISQGYLRNHRALDLTIEFGTSIAASTNGIVIRRIDCTACEEGSRPNRFPCPRIAIESEAWGFGYGNFVVVRHTYDVMPQSMRDHMDNNNLRDGFVYILYAHFSENRVKFGDFVQAGDVLGLTGNHGCSSAPHLHFEVRMGRDEIVDGRWLDQIPVNPNIVFET